MLPVALTSHVLRSQHFPFQIHTPFCTVEDFFEPLKPSLASLSYLLRPRREERVCSRENRVRHGIVKHHALAGGHKGLY